MTATGRETGRALFGDQVVQSWLPYDLPFAVRAFYAHFRPAAGFLLETELWPNLVAEARTAGVPLYLVNARLSERSARAYARFSALTRPMLGALAGVAAQSEADATRLAALGAQQPDRHRQPQVRRDGAVRSPRISRRDCVDALRPRRVPYGSPASTRDGEEALILDALARTSLCRSDVLTVIVPRHPQRFDAVAELLRGRAIAFVRRSDGTAAEITEDTGVVLGDSMGEMLGYYAAAELAFVGGSLLPLGGQNLIEPLAVGTPVLIGPHTFNFAEATAGAIAAGAALRVDDADALIAAVRALLADRAPTRGDAPRGAWLSRPARRRRGSAVGLARGAPAAVAMTVNRSGARLICSRSASVSVPTACLSLQLVDDEVVVGLREVEARLEDLLLLVEHVEIGAHADLEPDLGRVVRDLRRHERLLERLDLRDAAGDPGESGLRRKLRSRAAQPPGSGAFASRLATA